MKTKTDHHRTGFARRRAIAPGTLSALLLAAWLTGCAGQPATTPAPATPTAISTAAPTRAVPSSTPAQKAAEGDVVRDDVITLTWWTPEFLSPQAPQPTGPTLTEQLAEFERLNDGRLRVNPIPKARYGKGGLLDLLRTAQPVAPGILPDIVTLDGIELEQAVTAGLLQPLDGQLSAETTAGLYTFARSAGEFQGQLLAVQYLADFEHIAYLTGAVPTPPRTWEDLLSLDAKSYLFALGAPQSSAITSGFKSFQYTVLSQYVSAGATVDASNRRPALEETPLLRLLHFYRKATDDGLLPPNAIELGDTDAIWDIFAQGRLPMAQVNARRYLAESELQTGVGFAAAPGWAAPVVPIAGGWALAVVATAPERQQAAADLLTWLLRPENAGALAAATGWLPTSPAALDTWGSTPYHEFVDEQLAAAVSHPIGPEYSQTIKRLQKAIVAVLSEGVSPEDATANALTQ